MFTETFQLLILVYSNDCLSHTQCYEESTSIQKDESQLMTIDARVGYQIHMTIPVLGRLKTCAF